MATSPAPKDSVDPSKPAQHAITSDVYLYTTRVPGPPVCFVYEVSQNEGGALQREEGETTMCGGTGTERLEGASTRLVFSRLSFHLPTPPPLQSPARKAPTAFTSQPLAPETVLTLRLLSDDDARQWWGEMAGCERVESSSELESKPPERPYTHSHLQSHTLTHTHTCSPDDRSNAAASTTSNSTWTSLDPRTSSSTPAD